MTPQIRSQVTVSKSLEAMSVQRQDRIAPAYFFLYAVLLTAHIWLVWALPYFPTQDGPSHIYNLVILNDLLHGGKEWGRIFTYKLHVVPNLGFHLIAYPLLQFFPPLIVEKIFVSIYIFLMGVCVPFFLRSFDKTVFPTAFLVFPATFNFTLMMGFYSYVIAVPFFLLATSLAWRTRNKRASIRFISHNLAGSVIFLLHLIPFIFYLMALAIFAIAEHKGFRKAAMSLAGQLLLTLPLLSLLAYYISTGSSSPIAVNFTYLFSVHRAAALISDLLLFSMVFFSPWQLVPASMCLFILLSLLTLAKNRAALISQAHASNRAIILLASTLTAIYLVAPSGFGDGSYFNQRFPWVILVVLFPMLAGANAHNNTVEKACLIMVAILSFGCNSVLFGQKSREVATFMEGLRPGCSKGEPVMLFKRDRDGAWPKIDTILHAASYYGIFNGCIDIGNYEVLSTLFPVRLRKQHASFPPQNIIENDPDSINFYQYPTLMEVIGWKLLPQTREHLQSIFTVSFENSKLTLLHRRSNNYKTIQSSLLGEF